MLEGGWSKNVEVRQSVVTPKYALKGRGSKKECWSFRGRLRRAGSVGLVGVRVFGRCMIIRSLLFFFFLSASLIQ
jgi:hypothetical protein